VHPIRLYELIDLWTPEIVRVAGVHRRRAEMAIAWLRLEADATGILTYFAQREALRIAREGTILEPAPGEN
jgi:hypothetical protein